MLILTGSEVAGKLEILCSVCHRVVGICGLDEIAHYAKSLDAIYCFDCDQVVADSVHPSLYDGEGRYFLWFDGACRSINLIKEVSAKSKIIQLRDGKICDLYEHLKEVFQR